MSVLSADQFEQLYEALNSRDDARRLAAEHERGVSYNALVSIYAQKYQRAMKRSLPSLRARSREYHDLVVTGRAIGATSATSAMPASTEDNGVELLELAESLSVAPCVLARLVLEVHVELHSDTLYANQVASKLVTLMLRQPLTIRHERLRAQVEECVRFDDNYSPLVEKLRHSIGTEYEHLLQARLRNLAVPFLTEDELVASGYPKTPDIKFEVPLLLDGRHIVNWIESKATFGDPDTMATSLADQFAGYCNRYGPGLVIYWFGFVEPPAQPGVVRSVEFRASLPRRRHWTRLHQ